MFDIELQRRTIVVIVDGRLIDRSDSMGRGFREIETYGLDRQPAPSEGELEMLVADHTLLHHIEVVAKAGSRETLSPDAVSKEIRGLEAEQVVFQAAVRLDHALEVGGSEQGTRCFLERLAKSGEIVLTQREPGGGGVTAEFEDHSRMAHCDTVERVTQVKSRNRTP